MTPSNRVPTDTRTWYKAYRKQKPTRAIDALQRARWSAEGYRDASAVWARLSPSSRERCKTFFDAFIREEITDARGHSPFQYDRTSDWINDPERAERCDKAAANGSEGSTHSEVIEDWRSAYTTWCHDKRTSGGLFSDAFRAQCDLCELWHDYHGTLHQEIG